MRLGFGIFLLWLFSALNMGSVGCSHKHGHRHDHGHGHDHGHSEVHEPGKQHQHDFSNAKKWAQRFNDPARDKWQNPKGIVEIMGVQPGDTVAEVGAGTGYMLPLLSQAVGAKGKVYALDVEQPLVDFMSAYAKERGLKNVVTMKIPLDNPSLQSLGVDRVLMLVAWHHIDA